jgi:Acyl-CoA dehydrogenase, N-terminal domain
LSGVHFFPPNPRARLEFVATRLVRYSTRHHSAALENLEPLMSEVWRDGVAGPGLANEVLVKLERLSSQFFSDAARVDEARSVPREHLEALAVAGFYGTIAPESEGGLGLGYPEVWAVVEELASSCLASTFVWAQHFSFMRAVLDPAAPAPLRQAFLGPAVRGEIKAGVALAGLLPGPPRLSAEPAAEGWLLNGEAPWVSGWGIVDLVFVVARGPEETLVSLLLDASPQPGLSPHPLRLSAANASSTVRLGFTGAFVGADRVVSVQSLAAVRQQGERLRQNGSFALGIAKRCCLLLGPSPLDDELVDCRTALDTAGEEEMPVARAGACELAVRASHALAVSRGSRAALAGDVAERLTREAAFLLLFASRQRIKEALLEGFHATGTGTGTG